MCLIGVFHEASRVLANSSQAATISSVALVFCMRLAARARRISSSRVGVLDQVGQPLGLQVALLHQPAAARVDQEPGVGGLVVVHRERERHEHRRRAHGRDLGHGAGAGAADDQVGLRKGLRRVLDEGREFGLHAGGGVVGAQLVDLLGAALVQHDRPARRRGSAPAPCGTISFERLGAQAAAHHQQPQRPAARPPGARPGPAGAGRPRAAGCRPTRPSSARRGRP